MNEYYKSKGHTDDIYIVGEVLSGSDEVAPYYQGLVHCLSLTFWYKLDWAIANSHWLLLCERHTFLSNRNMRDTVPIT